MLSLATDDAQRDHIVLTDGQLETAIVVSALLDILHDYDARPFVDGVDIRKVIDLANKWEFQSATRLIRLSLHSQIMLPQKDYTTLFVECAVKLKDCEAMVTMIRHWGDHGWGHQESSYRPDGYSSSQLYEALPEESARNDRNSNYLEGAAVFMPGSLDQFAYCSMPPMIHWAIARAILLVHKDIGVKMNWKKISKEFKRLMDDACESPHPPSVNTFIQWRVSRRLLTCRSP